jgi:hypothetical protein
MNDTHTHAESAIPRKSSHMSTADTSQQHLDLYHTRVVCNDRVCVTACVQGMWVSAWRVWRVHGPSSHERSAADHSDAVRTSLPIALCICFSALAGTPLPCGLPATAMEITRSRALHSVL